MHEVVHRWADGYGATIELTAITYDDVPYAHLVAEAHVARGDDLHHLTTAPADVMVDADDLRALSAAATAMADHLDAVAARVDGGGR